MTRHGPGAHWRAQRRARASMPSARSHAPCVTGPWTHRALGLRPLGQRREIDMRGQVALARFVERIGIGVAAHRLQRVADRGAFIAIVDDQRRAALRAPAAPRARAAIATRRARFRGSIPARRVAQMRRDDRSQLPVAGDRQEQRVLAARPAARASRPGLDQLADRQRVEEFVGDDEQRPVVGQAVDSRRASSAPGTRSRLRGAQRRAGLDQMDRRRQPGLRHRPQRIGGQRAAARAEFDIMRRRAAGAVPQVGAATAPISSPNIWLISGAVVKSPRRAQRIARRVIMRVRRAP